MQRGFHNLCIKENISKVSPHPRRNRRFVGLHFKCKRLLHRLKPATVILKIFHFRPGCSGYPALGGPRCGHSGAELLIKLFKLVRNSSRRIIKVT